MTVEESFIADVMRAVCRASLTIQSSQEDADRILGPVSDEFLLEWPSPTLECYVPSPMEMTFSNKPQPDEFSNLDEFPNRVSLDMLGIRYTAIEQVRIWLTALIKEEGK